MRDYTLTRPSLIQRLRRAQVRYRTTIPFHQRVQGRDYLYIAAFLLPFVVLYTGFTLWPLVATILYSLYDWNGSTPLTDFVGFENYVTIAGDPLFWRAFGNTLVFAIGNTIIKLPLSLLVAVLLTRHWLWFKRLFRTMFFAPLVIPVAMAGLIFNFLLNPANGAINDMLRDLGLITRSIDFLGNPGLAMSTVILISVWQIFGQYMIYWMAALQNVPEDVYEAAAIDGANEWQKLTQITLPMIRPVAIIILFLSFVNALKVFGLIVAMPAGQGNTEVVSTFIYTQALAEPPFRYGYASAAAVLFGLTVLLAVTTQGIFVRKAQETQ